MTPSASQREAFRRLPQKPLVLFHEFTAPDGEALRARLATLARQHGGALRWAANEEEVLCGRLEHYEQAASLHFPSRDAAQSFVDSPGWRAALAACTALQVAVLGEQPRAVAIASRVMAAVLPHWPFDNTIEPGEEPGVDVSTVMPTSGTIAAVRAHPRQDTPVAMINWLKFKPVASYPAGTPPASGKTAYHRYGKVALTTTHSLGAKLIFATRYHQILVGNGGDPGSGLWDEFALMQYPGRRTFGLMASLRRYRRGLADREAGLAEYGQGLTVTRPMREFVWPR